MSFGPFLGGKRVCLGKSLAELMVRVITPAIISQFDFEFVNPDHKFKKPVDYLSCITEPVIKMKIKQLSPI